MSSSIKTEKCPHCGQVIRTSTNSDIIMEYGSPFRTCFKCGKIYVDKEYTEPAFKKVEDYEREKILSKSFPGLCIAALSVIGGIVCLFIEAEYALCALITLAVGALYAVIMMQIQKEKNKKDHDRLMKEYAESLVRMQNPQYIAALKEVGIKVPEQFDR